MLLAINRHGALYIFASAREAEIEFEAVDVLQEAFEFCDTDGRPYEVRYSRLPRVGRFVVDIGAFLLMPTGEIDQRLSRKFVNRASHVESSKITGVQTLEELRNKLG